MAKRKATKRKKKKNSNSKILTYTAWGLASVALLLSALLVGYFVGVADSQDKQATATHVPVPKPHKEVVKKEAHRKRADVKKQLQDVLKKESVKVKQYTSAAHEIDDVKLVDPPKHTPKTTKMVSKTKKPRLAIIIDDVSTASQVRAVKNVGIVLTMSFLPPSPARPNSAKVASHEPYYMVHLPMEALHFSKEEPHTLYVKDSQQTIMKRIREIKKLFPKVHYINNHTGSKFTSNEVAMNRLIFALNKEGIRFVDSRTTAQTKAPKVLKNYGLKYVARDVFLDHHMEKAYVKGQIKEAVAYAKKYGSAIAIGHPHKNTLQALKESKKLLQEVELVRIDKVY